ncbi:MAG: alpha/beta fold hydrolase [Deltaproteobacteria bacterium]|nr:alpha/beta fold hydrolase [Deltaproteobacteria bacterium]
MFARIRPNLELAYLDLGPRAAPPLLLISGAGGRKEGWSRQTSHLKRSFRVLVPDNRGMGDSSVVDEDVDIYALAEDLVLLLDRLEIERVHAWGVSMGGAIAQELALCWPNRVSRLVLGCTHPGGEHRVGPPPWEVLRDTAISPEVYASQVVPKLFGREFRTTRAHLVEAFARARVRYPPDPVGVLRQWQAHDSFDAWDRLPELEHPTLVMTGDEDEVVDPQNAHLLADRIPNAELFCVHGGGHSYHVEFSRLTNRVVEDFLRE